MQMALLIAGVWALAAAIVGVALWKDRERAPERPLRRPLPGTPAEPEKPPRRRAPKEVPTYPVR